MKPDIFRIAVRNLLNKRMRSWLTVLSILIGIMAIFAIISFGQGLRTYINDISDEMGSNNLIVQSSGFAPPGVTGVTFSESNLKAVENTIGVDFVAPMPFRQFEVNDKKTGLGKYVYIMGMPLEREPAELIESMLTVELQQGRALRDGDKYKATIGYSYGLGEKVFDKPVRLRDKLYITNADGETYGFTVVGIYDEIGNPNDDRNFYIPIDTYKEVFDTGDNYEYLVASVNEDRNPDLVAERVERALRKDRNQKEGTEDFYVQTFAELFDTFGGIIDVLNGILALIALISVVVSAVNIANTMYTSVIERTKEIGIMKAIGARNSEIMTIFLIESGLLGMIGGSIGIFFGFLIAKAAGQFAASAGYAALQPAFPWWLILACLLFSFLVGMSAGSFPAYQASRQKPVDALRYE